MMTPSDRKDTTVTDFTPTHRVTGTRGDHQFDVGTLVRKTDVLGRVRVDREGMVDGFKYVSASGNFWWLSDDDVEELKPAYEDGKLYTLTREVRYDAENGVFRSTWQAPGVRRGILPADIEADPSGSVVRIPDPLPTGFGAIVRKNGTRYVLAAPETATNMWRGEDGYWHGTVELEGAEILYTGDPQ